MSVPQLFGRLKAQTSDFPQFGSLKRMTPLFAHFMAPVRLSHLYAVNYRERSCDYHSDTAKLRSKTANSIYFVLLLLLLFHQFILPPNSPVTILGSLYRIKKNTKNKNREQNPRPFTGIISPIIKMASSNPQSGNSVMSEPPCLLSS